MVIESENIIAGITSMCAGLLGWLALRAVGQIDSQLQDLRERADECEDERHALNLRLSVLEDHTNHKR